MKCFFYSSLLFSFMLLGFQINTKAQADVTLTTSATAASNIMQGSSTNILYIAKMNVATAATTVSSVDIPISGTVNATDLTAIYVYFNASTPSISGASLLNGIVPTFGAPHTFTINLSQAMAIGSSGYFIVTANTSATAVDGHTIVINGATAPVVFGFTTAANITNNQSNIAGTTSIQAADVTITTSLVAAAAIKVNSSANVVYITKLVVATEPVVVNSVAVPLTGTVNATDLSAMYVYFNAAAPTFSGATLLNGVVPTFAAPHTYTINISQGMVIGSSGYFIFTVNTSSTAVIGHTVKINGAASPVVFEFTTAANITNNQTDLAGVQTLPVNLISLAARAINNVVEVKWTTTSELNNAFFAIERSTNGVNFTTIGTTKASVAGNQFHDYVFIDRLPEYGANFYRLKQVDVDNQFKYSKVVEARVHVEAMTMSSLYPNPVKNLLSYTIYSEVNKKVMLQISTVSGKILVSQTIYIVKGKNQQVMNVAKFAGGQYQLSVIDAQTNARLTKQVVILR